MWLGSPPFISHEFRPFGKGTTRSLGDLLTMVINHLLTGVILQVVVNSWLVLTGLNFFWVSNLLRRLGEIIQFLPSRFFNWGTSKWLLWLGGLGFESGGP